MSKIKTIIGRILPSSKEQINVKFAELSELVNNESVKLYEKIIDNEIKENRKLDDILDRCNQLQKEIVLYNEERVAQNQELLSQIQSVKCILQDMQKEGEKNNTDNMRTLNEKIEKIDNDVLQKTQILRNEIIQTKRASKEAVWGEVFRDSVVESQWLTSKSFYPGRWAVGYQYLYALYRILNSTQPKKILELGLGQSTTMITQYAATHNDVLHRVVEHDSEWIDYYKNEFTIADNTEVVQMEIESTIFQSKHELCQYKDFVSRVGDMKYDFISVDAPFGAAENEYSRVDILQLIPQYLEESFIIMIDDANRKGETNTIQLVEEILHNNNIEFYSGKYVGDKDAYVIATPDKKFVCTL